MKKPVIVLILIGALVVGGYFFWSSSDEGIVESAEVAQQEEHAHDNSHEHEESPNTDSVVKTSHEKLMNDESHDHDNSVSKDDEHERQSYIAGKHYVVIDKPVDTETGDKVEVRELFWYYCGHCYNLEPYIHAMEATLTDKAAFVRQPAVFSERWEKGAVFFYVLKHLNEFDRLNLPLFQAIHRDGVEFNSQEEFVNWLNINGVDLTIANDAFKQYSVAVNVNKAKVNSLKYQAMGVPTLIVNGKYWVDATHAGRVENIFKVVDFLIEKELN